MIYIMSRNSQLVSELKKLMTEHGLQFQVLPPGRKQSFEALYRPDAMAAVVDSSIPGLPDHAWLDLLAGLGRRIPLVVVGSGNASLVEKSRYTETISWYEEPTAQGVLSTLDACGAIGLDFRKMRREAIPIYNAQVPLHMIQNNGALSVLVIDASSFRKIAIEYGSEAYHRVQECFNQLLFDHWGQPGCFRSTDVLCRRSPHSNTYYIFLEQSRASSAVPAPGVLERLADRLVVKLQNAFWRELFHDKTKRIVPDCISIVPDLAVGFATRIYNPCVDSVELVEQLLDSAREEARIQHKRMRDRQRELMQTLIQTPGLLTPHYQAVFQLGSLTRQQVDEVQKNGSLQPVEHLIYGFESLIRVRKDALDNAFHDSSGLRLDSRFLRPDVLFSLSNAAKVGLELDQTCLLQAVQNSSMLPGTLMVNILPRNLYNIDKLQHLVMDRKNLMFEVSETEAISNFDVMMKVRSQLEEKNMGIATDDFGKGYSGLEQIIKIKPDLIKLDRSLVQNIDKDEPKQAFVSGIIKAAQIAQANILAEGVERWEEAELLRSLGVGYVQGFLLHRPQPADQIVQDLGLERKHYDTVA